jgi:hypothetical protein
MRCLAIVCVLTALAVGPGSPSGEAQGQAPGPGIGFRNDLKIPVIVQGVSLVNNMQRRGQPILVNPGKVVWDNNLPTGFRVYSVYDASQQRVLLRDRKVAIQFADQFFSLRFGTSQVKMEQEPVPVPTP